MTRYEVIESKSWKHDDGRSASLYGAVPWTTEREKSQWKIVPRGYTVRDTTSGTVGIGRVPWATRAEAQAWADAANAKDRQRHEDFRARKTKAQLDAEIAAALANKKPRRRRKG
jgi:hypothetical protein